MSRKSNRKAKRVPGKGVRVRNTETIGVKSYHDQETFLHIHQLAAKDGVTLSEKMRQLVEFGLEVVEDGKDQTSASVTQTRA